MRTHVAKALRVALVLASMALTPAPAALACSRAVYVGKDDTNTVITVRSMDWAHDLYTNLWIFPRGVERNGAAEYYGKGSIRWKSRWGSVVTAVYEGNPDNLGTGATADGMNEKGLVANVLYLSEAAYPKIDPDKPSMSISALTQYFLDNYATVDEAVKALEKQSFNLVPIRTPDDKDGTMHWTLSDPTGDSAIIEYIPEKKGDKFGRLVVHHGKTYQVMTNSPTYDEQMELNTRWEKATHDSQLPGTIASMDRFIRASYYINRIEKTAGNKALASAFSVIRNVSAPLGLEPDPQQPNVAPTLWRTMSDHKNKHYYYESTSSPNVFWVQLPDIDFKEGNPTKKLMLAGKDVYYAGNATNEFKAVAKPFDFLPAKQPNSAIPPEKTRH